MAGIFEAPDATQPVQAPRDDLFLQFDTLVPSPHVDRSPGLAAVSARRGRGEVRRAVLPFAGWCVAAVTLSGFVFVLASGPGTVAVANPAPASAVTASESAASVDGKAPQVCLDALEAAAELIAIGVEKDTILNQHLADDNTFLHSDADSQAVVTDYLNQLAAVAPALDELNSRMDASTFTVDWDACKGRG